jgi:nitrous oxidase accessory protein NosD
MKGGTSFERKVIMKRSITRKTSTLATLFFVFGAVPSANAADLRVPLDYPTIQAAVNAAHTNDMIKIAPGVYTGQVQIISKVITLIGQPGTILRATTNMSQFPGSLRPSIPIMAGRSSKVTLRGLTFEGERLAERFTGFGVLQGIYLQQSSANVEDCAFYGFRESTPGTKLASAIAVYNTQSNAPEVDLRVIRNTFADNYEGAYFIGSGSRTNINVTVENNTVVGPGPLKTADTIFGILIREGASGRIAGNTVSGYSYVGTGADFPVSIGILASSEANYPAFGIALPVMIERNTLRDNQIHIYLVKADKSIVRNNRFQGTALGIIPVGLAVTGKDLIITNNQFEEMEEGIRVGGSDPNFGDILGAAVNAQVTSNRFCQVATPITVQPRATLTQAGMLLCPFPPPTLALEEAVLLSWPGEDAGWVVESATSVDGPWIPSDATTFIQGGRHSIAEPSDNAHRFFRLH